MTEKIFVEGWVTQVGFLPGTVPNRLVFVYRKHCRWLAATLGEDPPTLQAFQEALQQLKFRMGRCGPSVVVWANKDLIRGRKKKAVRKSRRQ